MISYECSKKIVEQMEKCICKLKIDEIEATGFFCKIPFPDKNNMLPVFITNNHVINKFDKPTAHHMQLEIRNCVHQLHKLPI